MTDSEQLQQLQATIEKLQREVTALHRDQVEQRQASEPSLTSKMLDRAVKFLIPVTLAIAGWLTTLETRVSDLEASERVHEAMAFTKTDAAALRAEMVQIVTSQPPPKWMTDAIGRIERSAETVAKAVAEIDRRMTRLETQLEKR